MKHGFSVLACMLLLQACARTLPLVATDAVHISEFDGDWAAVMKKTPAVQTNSGWKFDCEAFTEPFFLRVRNGVVSGYLETDENYSFRTSLDSRGSFSATIPFESFYRYKDNIPIESSVIALLLHGNLSKEVVAGQFVIGDTRMNLGGCSTDVAYEVL